MGTITSKKFADESFDKPARIRMAKIAQNANPRTNRRQCRKLSIRNAGSSGRKHFKSNSAHLSKTAPGDEAQEERNCTDYQVESTAARGFSQIYGVDYIDTYAPVVKLASIRILLAIAAIYGLEIHQMDVVTAFLAGDLEEEIYMEQPEGFEVGTSEEDLVCRKSLRPQASTKDLESEFPQVNRIRPNLRLHQRIIIAMWDDLIIFGKKMADLKAQLNEESSSTSRQKLR